MFYDINFGVQFKRVGLPVRKVEFCFDCIK